MTDPKPDESATTGRLARWGFWLGVSIFAVLLVSPAPEGLSDQGWRTAAVAALMAVWWATEAIPVPVTALLPLALFPLLDVATINEVTAPYANPLIYLFLGGFMIALAMQRWNLHRRIALNIVSTVGAQPVRVIAGFMLATAFLSMWVSNTATTVMMLPIGLSVASVITPDTAGPADENTRRFRLCLMLGIAYAASIGGMATLVGTPTNALLAGFMLENYGVEISFVRWMIVAFPLVLVLLPVIWVVLTRIIYPFTLPSGTSAEHVIASELKKMGPISSAEKRVALIFSMTALAWMFRPLLVSLPLFEHLTDAGIAIIGGTLLFLVPAGGQQTGALLNWDWSVRLPWGILILLGGGLSLAAAVDGSGLAAWFGQGLSFFTTWHLAILILAMVTTVIFLTELTSNMATTAAFLPVVGAIAVTGGFEMLPLAAPAVMAASCAFMLPVATPPNAIVYGSGYVTIPQMVRAGFLMNLISIVIMTFAGAFIVPLVFN